MPAADGGPMGLITTFAPFVLIIIVFYFLMIRPQQQQVKKHQAMVQALKRGDNVTLSNGMIGKVTRVENDEAMVEIAQGVNVRVIKSMISQVQTRTAVAANDTKSIAKS
ncbi:MAG: preprotein translocase subunit YajC [Brevundimonas sp.]|nr:MAG: preprotein translocase subunit YajC [Brevundimonas sp.]